MADCLNNEEQINSNLSESNVDALTSNLDGDSSVTSEMGIESSISSTMYSADATSSNLGSEEPLNSELDLPTTYTYNGSETDNIVVTVDNKGFIISASVKQIKFDSFDDFPETGSEHLIYIDATNKTLYGWNSNVGEYYKLVADVKVPTKLSELENDGDGTSPFATEEYVSQNGGKIDSISVNGTAQTIDENKNVNIKVPDVSNFITKAVNDLENYYTKSETYTQEEINQRISAIPKFSIKVVTELPTTDISETTVYLVSSGSKEQNLYIEYIYVNNTWEKLGEQTIDLTDYVKIETFNNLVNNTTQVVGTNGQFMSGGAQSAGTQSISIGKDTTSGDYGNSIGSESKSLNFGVSIGYRADTYSGVAIGNNATSGMGVAIGRNAKTTHPDGGRVDAIQLGTGTNSKEKSLQVYDDNIYDAKTHTLTVKNIELNGEPLDSSSSFMPIGSIFASAIPQTDSRVHLLDGSTISQTGVYETFANLIKELVSDGNPISCTQSKFDADIATYGQCGKFVIDDTAGTIRLPKITEFIASNNGGQTIGLAELDSFKSHEHTVALDGGKLKVYWGENLQSASRNSWGYGYSETASSNVLTGQAVGNSETKPKNVRYPYYIVLASGYKSSQVVDIDNVMNEVNSKTTLLEAYPIGSIYMSTNSISPAQRFGGTWERLKDRFLLGAGDNYTEIYKDNKDGTYEGIGGSATHTLTVDEMPKHSHDTNINTAAYSGDWVGSWGGYSPRQNSGNYFQGGTTATGGNQPHNNMPPYATVYMWQRVEDDDSGIELY